MTANFSYAPSAKKGSKTRPAVKIEKSLKRILIIAGIIFSAELIWLFGISPFIPFSVIEVNTFTDLTARKYCRRPLLMKRRLLCQLT